jgi:ribosomal protein S5
MGTRVREALVTAVILIGVGAVAATAQQLGRAGTVQGTVTDPTGGAMQAVEVARFSIIDVTNKEALYSFPSTFSGTHFVTPQSYQISAGVTFQPRPAGWGVVAR